MHLFKSNEKIYINIWNSIKISYVCIYSNQMKKNIYIFGCQIRFPMYTLIKIKRKNI